MKCSRVVAALVAVALIASCATPQKQTQTDLKHLRIATEGAYPPFNYVANDGSLQGFDIDIAKALCAKMQADCTIVQRQWADMFQGLLVKDFDVIVASMDITPERARVVAFSNPYYNVPRVLVGRKDVTIELGNDGHVTPASFTGLRVGVVGGTHAESYAHGHFGGAEVIAYGSIDAANADFIARRLDLRFDEALILGMSLLKGPSGDQYRVIGKGYSDRELGDGEGIAVRREDGQLLSTINAALAEIHTDGTYQRINAKYFDVDIYPAATP